jgi:hypothetical protein
VLCTLASVIPSALDAAAQVVTVAPHALRMPIEPATESEFARQIMADQLAETTPVHATRCERAATDQLLVNVTTATTTLNGTTLVPAAVNQDTLEKDVRITLDSVTPFV